MELEWLNNSLKYMVLVNAHTDRSRPSWHEFCHCSRTVLSWKSTGGLDTEFCLDGLEMVLYLVEATLADAQRRRRRLPDEAE